jgi:cation diffusion facilitator CzcD-associated flavoprotein CzcO
MCPDRTYTILEGRADLGGTWDLFRYPGIRSDSDMHTLGYSFKPWTDPKTIADGPSILSYLREPAAEYGIDQKINYQHQVTRAEFSSDTATWTVDALVGSEQAPTTFTCNYLFMCSGYYSYKSGYKPEFKGADDFTGEIVHPQEWPEDLDVTDKNVVVIGSGATAVTIVPAIADQVKSVTMLQRSPTYMVSRPSVDNFSQKLRKVLPEKAAYNTIRKLNSWRGEFFYNQTRTKPEKVREQLLGMARKSLGDAEVEKNFTPSYNPWDQRLCLMPDGDFFEAIKGDNASVLTDEIDRFDATGIQLTSGERLDADIIVTATGLQLVTVGDMDFIVDGEQVDFSNTWTYRGVGYSDVPNMASSFGYINASWTLRSDLTCEFVCRILNHMSETNTTIATPRLRPADQNMPERPWIDDFSSGYMTRMMPLLPRQGDREPWTNPQRYSIDKKVLRNSPLEDGAMIFSNPRVPAST